MSDEKVFLLTPLREGRHCTRYIAFRREAISTHAPAGGATVRTEVAKMEVIAFLLTPLREGRQRRRRRPRDKRKHFYSRPCGRGDALDRVLKSDLILISTHAPAGGATQRKKSTKASRIHISTHAPAGGATAAPAAACHAGRRISTHAPAGGATSKHHASSFAQ